jgi:hypothetical protein
MAAVDSLPSVALLPRLQAPEPQVVWRQRRNVGAAGRRAFLSSLLCSGHLIFPMRVRAKLANLALAWGT